MQTSIMGFPKFPGLYDSRTGEGRNEPENILRYMGFDKESVWKGFENFRDKVSEADLKDVVSKIPTSGKSAYRFLRMYSGEPTNIQKVLASVLSEYDGDFTVAQVSRDVKERKVGGSGDSIISYDITCLMATGVVVGSKNEKYRDRKSPLYRKKTYVVDKEKLRKVFGDKIAENYSSLVWREHKPGRPRKSTGESDGEGAA